MKRLTWAQWLLTYYAHQERESDARQSARDAREAWREMLIGILGLRLGADREVIPLSVLTGRLEIINKLLEEAREAGANERAAKDEDFDKVSEDIRRAAMGETPRHAPALAHLLTDDHTDREHEVDKRVYAAKVRRAGVKPRVPPVPVVVEEAPDAADRARAGVASPEVVSDAPDAVALPKREGGLFFDDDVLSAYRASRPRALSMDDPETALALEQHRKAHPRPAAPSLTDLVFAAELDPATAPIDQLAAIARSAGLVQSGRGGANVIIKPRTPTPRGVDPLDEPEPL